MNTQEIIERRLRYWQARLAKADGKYHSDSQNIDEKSRIAAMHECRRCQTVLTELESLLEEVRNGRKEN